MTPGPGILEELRETWPSAEWAACGDGYSGRVGDVLVRVRPCATGFVADTITHFMISWSPSGAVTRLLASLPGRP